MSRNWHVVQFHVNHSKGIFWWSSVRWVASVTCNSQQSGMEIQQRPTGRGSEPGIREGGGRSDLWTHCDLSPPVSFRWPDQTSSRLHPDHLHHGCLRYAPRTTVSRPADGAVSRPDVPGGHRGGLWSGKSRTSCRQRPGQYPHPHSARWRRRLAK